MTRAYSVTFKRKMVARLTGKDSVSANQLSREAGVRQQNLSRWLREARSLPDVKTSQPPHREWTVARKAQSLADASELAGDALMSHLDRAGVAFAEFEQWRLALEEGGSASVSTSRQIRKLERELARKEKALAEAATLLVLKKTIESSFSDGDNDTAATSER